MLELTMAAVTAADAGATAGMQMAEAPSEPGAVLRVGRDKSVCRLSTPDDWLFVSGSTWSSAADPTARGS